MPIKKVDHIGFGCESFNFSVYIANKPNMQEYQSLTKIHPLVSGEINVINTACGNGWRKVFNVYAKVLFALNADTFNYQQSANTWQRYRDQHLLQACSNTALLFTAPHLGATDKINNTIHIICGRTYAKQLINAGKITVELTWLDEEFAINKKYKLVVCPYFDYRQLSNKKIERLAQLVDSFSEK